MVAPSAGRGNAFSVAFDVALSATNITAAFIDSYVVANSPSESALWTSGEDSGGGIDVIASSANSDWFD